MSIDVFAPLSAFANSRVHAAEALSRPACGLLGGHAVGARAAMAQTMEKPSADIGGRQFGQARIARHSIVGIQLPGGGTMRHNPTLPDTARVKKN